LKISFYNIGCKVNFAEISQIAEQFAEKGFETVGFDEPADIVLINTCTVTNNADVDSRKVIRRAIKSSPDAFIGVLGCYSQLKPGEVAEIEGVDAVFGTGDKFNILQLIDRFEKKQEAQIFVTNPDEFHFNPASSIDNESHTRIVLKIQDGCDYQCSYCTIPQARGGSRSMPIDDILLKIKEIESAGFKEIILSGINIGEYSTDNGLRFLDAVKRIEESQPKLRIRISSIEPNLFNDEILNIIADSEIFCHHFHIPLQSGSADILKLMRRRYNKKYFGDLLFRIKDRISHCGIGIDVITGFPGETDKHFEETYDFLKSLPFTYMHVFSYSERAKTAAISLPGKVHHSAIKERTKLLRELSDDKKFNFFRSQLNSIQRVLPETLNEEDGLWSGWTDNYIRVKFPCDLNAKDLLNVKLLKHEKDYMIGENV
jgi:threonylcarbamoyladenosine tRNA methylthiotransferase MtaB